MVRNVAPGDSAEPIQSLGPPQVPPSELTSLGPTLAELRQAAAESDEALDQMLASRSVTLSGESVSFRSLWQESL